MMMQQPASTSLDHSQSLSQAARSDTGYGGNNASGSCIMAVEANDQYSASGFEAASRGSDEITGNRSERTPSNTDEVNALIRAGIDGIPLDAPNSISWSSSMDERSYHSSTSDEVHVVNYAGQDGLALDALQSNSYSISMAERSYQQSTPDEAEAIIRAGQDGLPFNASYSISWSSSMDERSNQLSILDVTKRNGRKEDITSNLSTEASNSYDVQQDMPDEGASVSQAIDRRTLPDLLQQESPQVPIVEKHTVESFLKCELFIKDAARGGYYAVFPASVIRESKYFSKETCIQISSKKLLIADRNPFLFGPKYDHNLKLTLDIAAVNVTEQKSTLHELVEASSGELFRQIKILIIDEYAIRFLIEKRVAVYLKQKSLAGYVFDLCPVNADMEGLLMVRFKGNEFCANDVGTIMYVKDMDDNPYMLSMLCTGFNSPLGHGTAILCHNIQELCKEMNIIKPIALNDDEIFVKCDKELLDSLQIYPVN